MIFLDHAATSKPDPRVLDIVASAMTEALNPSSVHQHGQKARVRLEEAREFVAETFHVSPRHVVFTASASEANNLAIRGFSDRFHSEGKRLRVLASPLEHACVRETVEALYHQDRLSPSHLAVDSHGRAVFPQETDAFDLLCLMGVQNETGVVQDVVSARDQVRGHGARWLCDITQGIGLRDWNPGLMGVGLFSLSSHKIYGPPGVGVLVGPAIPELFPQVTGGPQENERRAGTQPVALILGFAEALRLAIEEAPQRQAHLLMLEEAFLSTLQEAAVPFHHNGHEAHRAPGFLNLSIPGFTGADLVIALDARGFSTSSGSACSTGVMEISPALAAMHPDDEAKARSALRITPGKDTTREEITACATALAQIVANGKPTGRFSRRT